MWAMRFVAHPSWRARDPPTTQARNSDPPIPQRAQLANVLRHRRRRVGRASRQPLARELLADDLAVAALDAQRARLGPRTDRAHEPAVLEEQPGAVVERPAVGQRPAPDRL